MRAIQRPGNGAKDQASAKPAEIAKDDKAKVPQIYGSPAFGLGAGRSQILGACT